MDWLAIAGFVLFLLGLIASIALHEVGHLVPAKLFGVKVTQYMVGFGSTVWSVRRGETEYGVKAIPLGMSVIGACEPERAGIGLRCRHLRALWQADAQRFGPRGLLLCM
jgi:hypothetical protein